MTSIRQTSARPSSTMRCAVVIPTKPEPTTVTFAMAFPFARGGAAPPFPTRRSDAALEAGDDRVRHLLRADDRPRVAGLAQVVGHLRAVGDDRRGRLLHARRGRLLAEVLEQE